jgi:dTDP-4-dehydrorhamnose reductase
MVGPLAKSVRRRETVGDTTVILVFGTSGQVATELAKLPNVVCLGRAEADLTHPTTCADAIRGHRPDAVINAAAYTAVDRAEADRDTAHVVNAVAPEQMAIVCAELGIPFVHISTDYVFDGSGDRPWQETDVTAPLGIYGKTKRDGESAVMTANPTVVILRTSWVFSQHGTNFVKTMLRLGATRNSLSVVADQVGGPTPARAIAQACHHIATHFDAGKTGIYHFAGQPYTTWADFARTIFDGAQIDVDICDITTADYSTPAKRPLNSRLDCSRILTDFGIDPPDWRVALAADLARLTKD